MFSVVNNLSAACLEQPGDRPQRRRLACAIRPDERDDVLLHPQRHALQRRDHAVIDDGVLTSSTGESGFRHRRPGFCSPGGFDDWSRRPLPAFLGDLDAMIPDDNPLANAHDHLHVMLDEEHRDLVCLDALDQFRQFGISPSDSCPAASSSSSSSLGYGGQRPTISSRRWLPSAGCAGVQRCLPRSKICNSSIACSVTSFSS